MIDPRSPIVEVMARLGRETQLHLDERHRHFKVTDKVILTISLLLIFLAVVNVYYVTVLYQDLNGIVANMDSMFRNLSRVDRDMNQIAGRVRSFERHMQRMEPITGHMTEITAVMPKLGEHMESIKTDMQGVEDNMRQMTGAMGGIANQMNQMTSGMGVMRHNVRQIAGPMGAMNPILPN